MDDLFAATTAAWTSWTCRSTMRGIATSSSDWTLTRSSVLDDADQPIREAARKERMRAHLVEELDDPEDYPHIVHRHTPRQLKHFPCPPK